MNFLKVESKHRKKYNTWIMYIVAAVDYFILQDDLKLRKKKEFKG